LRANLKRPSMHENDPIFRLNVPSRAATFKVVVIRGGLALECPKLVSQPVVKRRLTFRKPFKVQPLIPLFLGIPWSSSKSPLSKKTKKKKEEDKEEEKDETEKELKNSQRPPPPSLPQLAESVSSAKMDLYTQCCESGDKDTTIRTRSMTMYFCRTIERWMYFNRTFNLPGKFVNPARAQQCSSCDKGKKEREMH
jgi:hypothetical protein